jgi:hypothetical protein
VKPILDDVQWEHWQEACAAANNEANPWKPDADAGAKQPQTAEPGDLESGLSDFLEEKTAGSRKRFLAPMLLKAEDAARVAGLAPDALDHLRIAARGAAEKSLEAWKSNFEQMVRAQIRDATAGNLKQRLRSINNYSFEDSYAEQMLRSTQPIWETAVNATLTPAQLAAWQKEVDARNAYRDKSITLAVLAEFDRKNPLTAAQWDKIEALLDKTMLDYGPDISRIFSSPWYQQDYTMFLPFACAPEKDLKAILTPDQWEGWTGSEEFANSGNYSRNVQQIHAQRVKEAK